MLFKTNDVSIGSFNIEQGYTVFSRSNYQTKRHSHYAIEIVYCLNGSFDLITAHTSHTGLQSAIIPPNLAHGFSCINGSCNLLFLDPLSAIGSYFMQQYHLASAKNVLLNVAGLDQLHQAGKFDIPLLSALAEGERIDHTDPRVLNCIKTIDTLFSDEKISISQLSETSFLSKDRLAHLFKAQMGISIHQYILWKKISLAVLKSRTGHSLTTCAHFAGFADSAHFNKAFYKMFGLNPSFVLKS